MGIDILGIDIMGVDILGIDIPAPTPCEHLPHTPLRMSLEIYIRGVSSWQTTVYLKLCYSTAV